MNSVLDGWNATERTYDDGPELLHERIVAQVRRTPDAIAVRSEGATLTYAELDARSNQVAHRLRALGVGPDVLVAVCLERSLEMIVGLLGVLKAGGAYVPVDPSYPRDRVEYMIADCAARVVLTQAGIELPATSAHVLTLDDLREPTTPLPIALDPEHLAYVIYTSGSTGLPKGAMNRHRGICNRLSWMQAEYGLGPKDVVLQKTPFSFDVSVWELFWPLLAGAELVFAKPHGHRDPRYLLDVIDEARVTTLHFVPSMLAVFLEASGLKDRARSVRQIMCSGEALPYESVERAHALLPHVRLHNLYGPTEAAVDVSYHACVPNAERVVPIGKPVANTQLHVFDRDMQRVGVDEPGELYLGGVQLGRGYWQRASLTADRFVPDPFGPPGSRLYRTGDLARWRSDGEVEYLGRIDHQIKIRGFRVELGEIETVLVAQPGCRAATVLLREDTPGAQRLVAYVVPADAPVRALRAACKEKLPEYMVPSAFVALPELPVTENGKLDRRALPAPSTRPELANAFVAPRDDLELRLVQLWEQMFGFGPLGATDDFFELGGSSLLALQLLGKIESELGRRMEPSELLAGATVEHLARRIRDGASVAFRELVPIQRGSSRPLFLVHPVGGNVLCYVDLARRLGPSQAVYAFQSVGLDGRSAPATDLVEMSTRYLAAAREVQPHGPYRLGGYSSGGVVAYEMAQQLRRAGEEVELLLMLDSRAPNVKFQSEGISKTRNFDDTVMSYWMLIILGRTLGIELPIELSEFEERTAGERVAFLLSQLQEHGLMPPGIAAAQMRAALDVYKANLRSLMLYAPQPYAGKVVLFKVAERLPDRKNAPNPPPWRWEDFVQGELEEHTVPGNHFVMLGKDVVEHVARGVRAVLDGLPSAS